MSKGITTIAQGQAGVHRVASELIMRGFKLSIPLVDDHGVDLIVTPGIRVQVKSAHLRQQCSVYPKGAYWFKLARQKYIPKATRSVGDFPSRDVVRHFSSQCEFVVLWGIEEHRFWVVPAEKMDNHALVVVGPEVQYRDISTEEIESLAADGLTNREIAARLDVCRQTIDRRRGGQFTKPKHVVSSQVRLCEGRWDLIAEYRDTMNEANRVVERVEVLKA